MKVGVDAREFGETRTGIGRYLEDLLTPIVAAGDLETVLFVNRKSCVPAAMNGPSTEIVELPALPTPIVDQFVIPHKMRRSGAQVFFSPYYKTPLIGGFKRVTTVHDIMFLRLPGENSVIRGLRAGLVKLFVGRADIVLCDSEFTRQDLSALLPSVADRIRVIYPGLDESWLSPPDNADQDLSAYVKEPCFFLYVGNFKPHKNVDLLVEGFAKSARNGRAGSHDLLLAGGDDRNMQRIRDLVESLGVNDRVHIHQRVPDDDLRKLYAQARWFISASGYEGFGYPFLEAMITGCPVICYPCTSIPEVTGGAAVEIRELSIDSIAEAIETAVCHDGDGRERFVSAGRTQAETLVPGKAHAQFTSIVESLP